MRLKPRGRHGALLEAPLAGNDINCGAPTVSPKSAG